MSWIDRLDTNIIIRLGDGAEFSPKWLPGEKNIEFNVAKFEFINVLGTLIKRSQPKGTIYNMLLVFDGEDHLDQSDAFVESAKNRNPWTIIHPYYGEILVQPSSIKIDNTPYNVSRLTIAIQETIKDEFPKSEISLTDTVNLQKIDVDNTVIANTPSFSPEQVATQGDQVDFIGKTYEPLATNDDDAESLRNLVNQAQADVVNGIDQPQQAMNSVIELINYPSLLQLPVKIRLQALEQTFENLISVADNLVVEKNGLAINSAMFQAASNPIDSDYELAKEVTTTTSDLLVFNDRLLTELDSRQSDRADVIGSYVPDFYSLNDYDLMLNTAISNLFQIAFNAKQERIFVLDYDSNPVNLTHRFYGMDELDENLDAFILQNNLGPEELFVISKGSEVVYYV